MQIITVSNELKLKIKFKHCFTAYIFKLNHFQNLHKKVQVHF